MNIGIDHGYYAIKTRHFSFPAGIAVYSHEPYTLQNKMCIRDRLQGALVAAGGEGMGDFSSNPAAPGIFLSLSLIHI